MAQTLRTVNATISRTNGHGFQTAEQPGTWWNLSKYADPAPIIPPVGTLCDLAVDSAGFVREIHVQGAPSTPPEASGSTERGAGAVCYERASLYAACLQASAMYHAGIGGASFEDVEAGADRFFRRAVQVGTRKLL